MKGHLHLVCAPNPDGQTAIREQSFRAPLHISKPYSAEGSLVVNMVNPTAGLFAGDEVDISCRLTPGATAVLTTPSAGRVFRARGEGRAVVRQHFQADSGAFLEFVPEIFIPHAGSRYFQQTRITAMQGAQIIFFEWLSPGRVASGESFAYEELEWQTDVFLEDRLMAREAYMIGPNDDSLAALRRLYPQAHYVSCFLCGFSTIPESELAALQVNDSTTIGWSSLGAGVWSIKALCKDNLHARRCLISLREQLYSALGRIAPSLRRF